MATSNEFKQADLWNHPIPSDDSHYGHSSIRQTKSGHVFEVDDTLGNERIGEHHKSGTSRTIKADGSTDIIIVGDAWITIIRDGHILINGEVNVTMSKTVKLHCKKLELEVEGDMSTTVHGNYNLKVDKNYALEVIGEVSEKIVGDKKLNCKNHSSTVAGELKETVSKGYTSTVGKDCNIISTGNTSITGGTGASLKTAGSLSLGGSSVGIDSASSLSMTALSSMNVLAPLAKFTTPLFRLSGAMIALGDVTTMLTGPVTLSTHTHLTLSIGSPTTPPIL